MTPPLGPIPPGAVDASVLERWAAVVAAQPAAVAVIDRKAATTVAEIDRRAEAVRRALVRHIGPGRQPITVLLGHDAKAVASVLGILKAGRPFTVLDPLAPPARLHAIMARAGAPACITDGDHVHLLEAPGAGCPRIIDFDAVVAGTAAEAGFDRSEDGDGVAEGGALAAVVFTSGSTGMPKGVLVEHRMLVHAAWGEQVAHGGGPGEVIAVLAPLAFAFATLKTFWSLLSGSALALYDPRVAGIAGLPAWMRSAGAAKMVATPSLLRSLADEVAGSHLDGIERIICGGEPLPTSTVRDVGCLLDPTAVICNDTGSSESGVRTRYLLRAGDAALSGARLPAGWPAPDKRIVIVGADGTPVGPGEVGEIEIHSRYLSPGYWDDPVTTAERFAEGPDGIRINRTGDRGRIGPDGCLEYTGRSDEQVKIRGYLVEPAEIERALLEIPGIAEAAVVGEVGDGGTRLVAYIVAASATVPSPAGLRRALAACLPTYMVPAAIVSLPALPRTERGKVDRAALRVPTTPPAGAGPRDSWESVLCDVWARVLGLASLGIHDNFFDVGGDSLAGEELLAAMAEELGVQVPSSVLIEAPTIAEFAERAAWRSEASRRTVVPIRTGGEGPPLFCVAGAGGLALTFVALSRHLGAEQPVYGLQARGLEQRAVPDWTIAAHARRYLREIRVVQPHGPYLLAGHSLGGVVALEIARRLAAAGEEVALLAVIDSYLPRVTAPTAAPPASGAQGGRWARVRREVRHGLPSVSRIRKVGKVSTALWLPLAGIVRRPGMAQLDVFHMQGAVLSHFAKPDPWDGRTVIYRASEGAWADIAAGWSTVLRGSWEVVEVPGDHTSMLRDPQVGGLAADLAARIDAALGRRHPPRVAPLRAPGPAEPKAVPARVAPLVGG